MARGIAPLGGSASTVRRVADVLGVFLDSRADAGVSEIARKLGCSKSVVHRILVALVHSDFLAADPVTRRYRLGPKALRLGLAALAHSDIPNRAVPYLQRIRDETGETAILSLLRGTVRIYAQQIESRETVRQTVQPGAEAPLYLGASGKAILAFLSEPLRAATMQQGRGARRSDGSSLNLVALEDDCRRIQRRGYAVSQSERIPGAVSVAAPIFDHSGAVIGSLSAAGVAVRSDPRRIARYGAIVRREAEALSDELGWTRGQRPVGGRGRASG